MDGIEYSIKEPTRRKHPVESALTVLECPLAARMPS